MWSSWVKVGAVSWTAQVRSSRSRSLTSLTDLRNQGQVSKEVWLRGLEELRMVSFQTVLEQTLMLGRALSESRLETAIVEPFLLACVFSAMGGGRNAAREAHVRVLNRAAISEGVGAIPENAGRGRVQQLMDTLRGAALAARVAEDVRAAFAGYEATFPAQPAEPEPHGGGADGPHAQAKTWKFSAVQLTYNKTSGDLWQ